VVVVDSEEREVVVVMGFQKRQVAVERRQRLCTRLFQIISHKVLLELLDLLAGAFFADHRPPLRRQPLLQQPLPAFLVPFVEV
jgi:hypothetical protein